MNNIHKTTLVFFSLTFLLMFSSTVHAQSKKVDKRKEKMDALKVTYISENLDLSVEQWQRFWPIYNDFHKNDVRLEKRKLEKQYSENPDQASQVLDKLLALESNALDRKHAFLRQLDAEFGPKIPLDLNEIEQKFKHRLLKRFKNNEIKKGN